MMLGAAGFGEGPYPEGPSVGMFCLAVVTYLLVAILMGITLQTLLEFVVARPQITIRQIMLYMLAVALATWFWTIVHSTA